MWGVGQSLSYYVLLWTISKYQVSATNLVVSVLPMFLPLLFLYIYKCIEPSNIRTIEPSNHRTIDRTTSHLAAVKVASASSALRPQEVRAILDYLPKVESIGPSAAAAVVAEVSVLP